MTRRLISKPFTPIDFIWKRSSRKCIFEFIMANAAVYLKEIHTNKAFSTYLRKENRIYNAIVLVVLIVQFSVFKMLYPYPDFFSDSYSYIFAASAHLDANIWPIGYSKFLLAFHAITHSATALNFFQFMFLGVSSLYFYHTVVYNYPTGKYTRSLLFLLLFLNPINLYLANYVSSDALFIGLSLIWLSEVIWVIYKPGIYHVLLLSLIFFLAFTIRYNAMYYPAIAAVVFLSSSLKPGWKIAAAFLGPILVIPFVLYTSDATKQLTGTAQFPPILGGWQWANNALYFRGFIEEDSTGFPTPQTAELDQMARKFFAQPARPQDVLFWEVANFFIRHPEAPLKQYMYRHYPYTDAFGEVVSWGKVAPTFDRYGKFLIKRHPLAFARYYLLVNTRNYFLPPLEKLEIYNLGEDAMAPVAANWFNYDDPSVTSVSPVLQGYLLFLYPGLFLLINLYFLRSAVLLRPAYKVVRKSPLFAKTALAVLLLALLNFAFSVFANIIVIRYQLFPMIVLLAFGMVFVDIRQFVAAVTGPADSRGKIQTRTAAPPQLTNTL